MKFEVRNATLQHRKLKFDIIFTLCSELTQFEFVIFIIPIIDSASIYLYRLSIGRSPFSADKFHLHHLFLLYTNSHLVSTLSISSLYIFVIVLFSLMVFSSTTVFFISAYFMLIFALILVSNIVRIKSKEKLAKL